MSVLEQNNILNNYYIEFFNEYNNFNKITNINEHLEKINVLCDGKCKLSIFTLNTTNESTNESINTTNESNNKSNIFGDKKIKRKHLLNKIHPDKLSRTMSVIKNKLVKTNQEFTKIFDFNEEERIISLCVVKIISNKLNIIDCFKLLEKNINQHIFDNLCLLFGLNTNQIDKLKITLRDINNLDVNKKNFESNFSQDIVNFINSFNKLNMLKSPEYQISYTFKSIFDLIKNYIIDNIFKKMYFINYIINNIDNEIKIININYNYELEKSKIYSNNNKNISNINNLFEKRNELYESSLMFNDENKIFINVIKDISNKTIYDIIYNLIEYNVKIKSIYLYLEQLKKDLPYFYEYLNSIKITKISESYYIIPSMNCDKSMEIAKLEMLKVKLSI
jgi:hypothetical protein